MDKKYGGYTAAELREKAESGFFRGSSAYVIHDLLDALSASAEATQAVAVPEGWKLVPAEATQTMILAGAGKVSGRPQGKAARYVMAEAYAAMLAAAPQAPVADAARVEPVNLEGLRKRLLAPRKILRDESGWLTHPDYPVCDEGTRADSFLEAFGIETAFVGMESDSPDFAERWHEEGLADCSEWTPAAPAGDGWVLLEIYDTEDGPYALFGRDHYEAEQARKREHTLKLREGMQAIREGRAAAPAQQAVALTDDARPEGDETTGGAEVERATSKGSMVRIKCYIEKLQKIQSDFGNTCVYVRDASWGAVALNRFDADEKEDAARDAALQSHSHSEGEA